MHKLMLINVNRYMLMMDQVRVTHHLDERTMRIEPSTFDWDSNFKSITIQTP